MKAYKLLNMETKENFYYRDVVFHEYIFPYHHSSRKGQSNPFHQIVIPSVTDDGYIDCPNAEGQNDNSSMENHDDS